MFTGPYSPKDKFWIKNFNLWYYNVYKPCSQKSLTLANYFERSMVIYAVCVNMVCRMYLFTILLGTEL